MGYAGRDFSPIDAAIEREQFGFDFAVARGNSLDPIDSVAWELRAVAGDDPQAASRLIASTIEGQAVSAMIGGVLAGTRYRLMAVATFNSGAVLDLYAFFECVSPARDAPRALRRR